MSEREPWEIWGLTPYQPDSSPTPAVSLCVPPIPKQHLTVVAYAEVTGCPMCDKRMHFHHRRERGRYGRRSSLSGSSPCPNRAIILCELSDGTIVARCKEHVIA